MTIRRRLGAFRPLVRLGKHGQPMRDPNGHDIDITTDLVDGSDGALADRVPLNQQGGGEPSQNTQHVHGDAVQVNKVQRDDAPKPTTLRDQLSSAFKGDEGKPTDQANAQNVQAPVDPNAQQPAAQAPALTKDTDGKYRNPDGTFASAEQVQAFEAAQAQPAAQVQSPLAQSLTAHEAQQLQSLPAELRQYVERTMEGLNTRAARYSEYDLIENQILGPRRQAFAAQGTTPAVALNQLFALSDFAGRDPGNFVLWFSQQRNLDLDALLDARDAAQNSNPVDPAVQELRGQVQQLSGHVQQFQQRDVQAAQQANLNAVQTFATEKDATGVLVRPYLTDIMDSWATQITAVRAANPNLSNNEVLQRAYDNACWADPNVRGKMQQASDAARRTEQAQRVQAARQAGSSVTGGPASEARTSSNNSNRSLREELEQQFSQQRAI